MSTLPKLIIALDFDDEISAWTLIDKLDPNSCALKVGSELFTHLGPDFVRALVLRQFRVFLDLKFHDIPHTVAKACIAAAELGVWMLNVHASGGVEMMRAAREAIDSLGTNRPLLIAVTVLTSMTAEQLWELGVRSLLLDHVCQLAKHAKEAGLDGVVSSALEVASIKARCGTDFLAVTPGIRLADDHQASWKAEDDQHRIITPRQAIQSGSDYLVVGRPITRAKHPEQVVQDILLQLQL